MIPNTPTGLPIKQEEEPEIIIIDDDSTHVKQEEDEGTAGRSCDRSGIPREIIRTDDSAVQGEDHDDEAVQNIASWLKDVIGYDYNNVQETERYARKIIACGAHSVEMILDCVPRSIVDDEFTWMKPVHRLLLKQKLKE